MPIHMARDVRESLGAMAEKASNPSLLHAKFPVIDGDWSEAKRASLGMWVPGQGIWLDQHIAAERQRLQKERDPEKRVAIGSSLQKAEAARVGMADRRPACEAPAPLLRSRFGVLRAKSVVVTLTLESRLIVDQAVGLVENAGLCLDRHCGLPYVPGSAVKGIARLGAEQGLASARRECQFVFGWAPGSGDDDLPENLKGSAAAGAVAFLPAYPRDEVAPVDVDIVNCHHPRYYGGDEGYPGATDDESPNPQFFPAVKQGAVFEFMLLPIRRSGSTLIMSALGLPSDFDAAATAAEWLTAGLIQHGIGAKTASGYGWFSAEAARPAEAGHTGSGGITEREYGSVRKLADNPGQWENLRREIQTKLRKPENAKWMARFRSDTAGKDYKDLRKKEWYPREG